MCVFILLSIYFIASGYSLAIILANRSIKFLFCCLFGSNVQPASNTNSGIALDSTQLFELYYDALADALEIGGYESRCRQHL